jgi:energy-coupling factor transport system ATP-binding protein
MRTRKIAQTIVLIAMVVVLSPVFIPLGPTKAYPFQHMANVIAGVLLGPWYAVVMAICAAIIRISLGVGTVFAFPGGMFGAFLAGVFYRWIRAIRQPSRGEEESGVEEEGAPTSSWRLPLAAYGAAAGEVIGTGLIGATLSALVVDPLLVGRNAGWVFFVGLFSVSSIAGAIIGLLGLGILRRAGYWK